VAGDARRALTDLDEAIRLDPKYARAYLHRGRAYQALNDRTRAQADFQTAGRLDPALAKK
jgi:Tfp pilus assembly protein PilF